jgi:hypothetical protein
VAANATLAGVLVLGAGLAVDAVLVVLVGAEPVVVELLAGAVGVLPVVLELLDVVVALPVVAVVPADELVAAVPLAAESAESPHADSKPIRIKAETQRSALVLDIRPPQISFDQKSNSPVLTNT